MGNPLPHVCGERSGSTMYRTNYKEGQRHQGKAITSFSHTCYFSQIFVHVCVIGHELPRRYSETESNKQVTMLSEVIIYCDEKHSSRIMLNAEQKIDQITFILLYKMFNLLNKLMSLPLVIPQCKQRVRESVILKVNWREVHKHPRDKGFPSLTTKKKRGKWPSPELSIRVSHKHTPTLSLPRSVYKMECHQMLAMKHLTLPSTTLLFMFIVIF